MRKVRRTLAGVVLATAATLTGLPASAATADIPFYQAVFGATHNSYSGNIAGERGSIRYQLDHGIRGLEFDVLEEFFAATGDYTIGHGSTGFQVDHSGGNPQSNALRPWLSQVAAWSGANPGHAPVVVTLDLKNDLTDNASFAAGNLAALNKDIQDVFGSNLVLSNDDPGILPSIDALRGRVIVVLSGDLRSRTLYRRDLGKDPAVALNSHGQVVEVHKSETEDTLWYWSGVRGADGRVKWLRHGKYDNGVTPAVALNDAGQIVEVHKSQNNNSLWYRVGQLGADSEITWSASRQYDNGLTPTVRFASPAKLVEVHRNQANTQNYRWSGALNVSAKTVTWTGVVQDPGILPSKALAVSGSRSISVWTQGGLLAPPETLNYTTDLMNDVRGENERRIRYPQLAFVEFQEGNAAELERGAKFYAAPATNKAYIDWARWWGVPIRGWDFDDSSLETTPLVANFPATNFPWQAWYQEILTRYNYVR